MPQHFDPWPATVRSAKFGNATGNQPELASGEFELKKQVADFVAHVRAVQEGVIPVLEVRGGLPFLWRSQGVHRHRKTRSDRFSSRSYTFFRTCIPAALCSRCSCM